MIDEPAEVLTEVQSHFQQWTSKRQVQPLSGCWVEIYKPAERIDPLWYAGLMDPPTSLEMQQAIQNGPTGKAGGPTRTTNEMIKHLGERCLDCLLYCAPGSLQSQVVPLHGSVASFIQSLRQLHGLVT